MTVIMRERTKKAGRPKGSYGSKLDKYRAEIEVLRSNGATIAFVARRYGYSQVGMSDWMHRNKILKPEA